MRAKFVESHISKGIAFQIRSLRDREGWSQQELADKLGSNQNAIYRAENPNYGKHTITTLKNIATAFDVALIVRFVPFSQLIDWVSGTPFIDRGLSPNALSVPSFQTELEEGDAFELHEDIGVEEGLAKKISGDDKPQQQAGSIIPAVAGVNRQQGTRLNETTLASTLSAGRSSDYAAFGGSPR